MIVVKIAVILVFGFKEKPKNILRSATKCLRKSLCNVTREYKSETKAMESMKSPHEDEDHNDNIYPVQLSCTRGPRHDRPSGNLQAT